MFGDVFFSFPKLGEDYCYCVCVCVCMHAYTYIHIYMCVCVKVLAVQLCLTLCDPMDSSLLGSSVHGILQARRLK